MDLVTILFIHKYLESKFLVICNVIYEKFSSGNAVHSLTYKCSVKKGITWNWSLKKYFKNFPIIILI